MRLQEFAGAAGYGSVAIIQRHGHCPPVASHDPIRKCVIVLQQKLSECAAIAEVRARFHRRRLALQPGAVLAIRCSELGGGRFAFVDPPKLGVTIDVLD